MAKEAEFVVRHAENRPTKKNNANKRKPFDELSGATPKIFKSKPVVPNPFDELVHHLTKLQAANEFVNFGVDKTLIQCTLHPSKFVSAHIIIRDAKELRVRVVFKWTREIIEIEDNSFGTYSIHTKVQRLKNLVNNLKRVQTRKEELFAELRNWKDFKKCNYENLVYLNHICNYRMTLVVTHTFLINLQPRVRRGAFIRQTQPKRK